MPKLKGRLPSYRLYKRTGQAVVTLGGQDHYLGAHGTAESRAEYDRLVGEWVAMGRPARVVRERALTIAELIVMYWGHCREYYTKNGRPTDEQAAIRAALKHVRALYGQTAAVEFGPLALKAVRERMIEAGNCRSHINKQVGRIRRMFSWAVENEHLPGTVAYALREVSGLRRGRTRAPERPPIEPVPGWVVDATIEALPETVAAMVRFQQLTGCRPEDVCRVRLEDIDRSGDVWLYRPETWKTQHQGGQRVIFVGPQCQAVLTPYLFSSPCFQPEKTDAYTTRSYRDAIHRAVKRANRGRDAEDQIPRWNPNQLRHSAGTEVRKRFGLEGAQVFLGHAKADVTQIYAEADIAAAVAIAREVG